MSPSARRLAVALITTSAGALPVFLTSALILQISAELDFAVERLGIGVGLYFAAGVLSSILMGRLAERLGPAVSLRLGGALSASCLLLIGWVDGLLALCACLFLGGVCNALCQPAANLYVTKAISPARRGLALALKQSAIPAATLVGGVAVPLVALTVGWRWAFWICAAVAALTACAVPELAAAPVPTDEQGQRRAPLPAMLLLAATVGCGAAAAGCLASFAVAGAVRVGLGEASAGWLVAAGSGLAVLTRVALGHRADSREGGHLQVVGRMLLFGGIGAIGLSADSVPLFVAAVPVVFAAGWGWPGLFNLSVIRHNPDAPAAATGFTQTGTYCGAAIGPLLFGMVADGVGWSYAWALVPLFFVLGTLASVAARAALLRHVASPATMFAGK